jgi:hypothetical protein
VGIVNRYLVHVIFLIKEIGGGLLLQDSLPIHDNLQPGEEGYQLLHCTLRRHDAVPFAHLERPQTKICRVRLAQEALSYPHLSLEEAHSAAAATAKRPAT